MALSPNKRIALNFVATYGRSIYALFLGLFSTRWILAALGNGDFGLWGVIGSLVVIIGFLNGILGNSVGRYYAYAIGESKTVTEDVAHDTLQRWFNAAVSIHFFLPLILCAIGGPIGIYAINHWLVIPESRMVTCEFVFMFSLVAAFLNMVSVPYLAMYRARQLIAELSVWGVLQTTLLFASAFMLLHYDGDRLLAYSIIMTMIPGVISGILVYRARRDFSACRIRYAYLFDLSYLSKIFSFSFWEFFATGGDVIRTQGTAILINRNFGATVNAAWTVGSQVSNHTTALSTSMISAITPALTTAAGAGERDRMVRLAYATSKFGAVLILLFAIPLILEMNYVLKLWLVTPPEYASLMCRCMLIALVSHKLGWGHHMAVLADGRVRSMLAMNGFLSGATILIVWGFIKAGFGPLGVGFSFVLSYSLLTLSRVFFARTMCSMSVRYWLCYIVLPVLLLCSVTVGVGLCSVQILKPSFLRLCVTSFATTISFLVMSWLFVCTKAEREICSKKFRGLVYRR